VSDIVVVIATYNSALTISSTLESICKQTVLPKKIILVDDGSTDTTINEVQKFDSKLDVEILSMVRNSGTWAARNAGFARVNSSLVAFVDSDDILLPQHIESHLSEFNDGIDAVATRYFDWLPEKNLIRLDPRKFPEKSEFSEKILVSNFMPGFFSIKCSVFRDVGQFKQNVTEDWDFWIRFFDKKYLAKSTESPSYLYRWSDGSLSRRSNSLSLNLQTLNSARLETHTPAKRKQCERTAKRLIIHAFFDDPRLLSCGTNELENFEPSTIRTYEVLTFLSGYIPKKLRKSLFKSVKVLSNLVNTESKFRKISEFNKVFDDKIFCVNS